MSEYTYDEKLTVLLASGADSVLRAAEKGLLFSYRLETGARVGFATMQFNVGGLNTAADCAMRACRAAKWDL